MTDPGVPLSGGSGEPDSAESSAKPTFLNVFIAEGSPEGIAQFQEELRRNFPDLAQEAAGEPTRHRDWLQGTTGGFRNSSPDQTIAGWTFRTPPILSSIDLTNSMAIIQTLKKSGILLGLTIGYIGMDTHRLPYAGALAFCSDSDKGVIGTLGNDRYSYFQVMQHLIYGDDSGRLLTQLANGAAIGPVPYIHRAQWNDLYSPLRLQFLSEDPRRGQWGLSLERPEGEQGAIIVSNGFLPPEGTSLSVHLGWRDAYRLMERAWKYGVNPYFDNEAQLMVSGYGLFEARVIDDRLRIQGTTDKVAAAMLDGEVTEDQARKCFMILYANLLMAFIAEAEPASDAYPLACDNLRDAYDWLAGNGLLAIITPGSSAVN